MGTIFWKPFCAATFAEFSEWAAAKGARIIGTSAHASVDFRQIKLDARPTILLLGSEQKGLLPGQLAVCDELISLPMRGRTTSLNLAVAAGIFLYALTSEPAAE
jgi:TrmH family RNA methyltransferase